MPLKCHLTSNLQERRLAANCSGDGAPGGILSTMGYRLLLVRLLALDVTNDTTGNRTNRGARPAIAT